MSIWIADALAETATNTTQAVAHQPASFASTFIMLGAFFIVFYFFMWRPQSKRAREHRDLLSRLTSGDEVLTTSGMMGKVMKVTDEFVVLSLSEGVEVKFQKPAIIAVLPKGTLKSV